MSSDTEVEKNNSQFPTSSESINQNEHRINCIQAFNLLKSISSKTDSTEITNECFQGQATQACVQSIPRRQR